MPHSQSYTQRFLYLLMVCITLSYSIPGTVLLGMEGSEVSSMEIGEEGEQDTEKEKESENEKEEIKHHLPGSLSELVAEGNLLSLWLTDDEQLTEIYSEISNPPPES